MTDLLASLPPLTHLNVLHGVMPAYIGPGAGFALGGSFLFALAGILLAFLAVLFWPVRVVIRALKGRGRLKNARARRVIVLGLDGLDPNLCRQYMAEGKLPNLSRLQKEGTFRPLGTTWPAMSPVGWSTFSTGTDPSGHNIFDFLNRDMATHLPILSSTRLNKTAPRKLGPLHLPGGGQKFELLKRSKPFWKTCAEAGIESSILRIPITFPPDKFGGRMLSAMCVPDLRGTQGTFSHYTEPGFTSDEERTTGGVRLELEPDGTRTVELDFRVDIASDKLNVGVECIKKKKNRGSPLIHKLNTKIRL